MSEEDKIDRRQFCQLAIAGSFLLSEAALASSQTDTIPYRTLGKTGVKVSLLGLGGYHIGNPSEAEGIKIIRTALDHGVNFLDNCWDYHDGESEIRMGKALLDGYRDKAFLMTKIDGRDRKSAMRQIDESLKRLRTDCIDLVQIHEVIRSSDPQAVFASGGAIEALVEARKAGKLRFIGFTGHKSPLYHLQMLNAASLHKFHFDTVQLPLNLMDYHFDSFEKSVLPVLIKQDIGVIGMKPLGGGIILRNPAFKAVHCLQYAMSLPVSVTVTGCDNMDILNQALGTARGFKPLSQEQLAAIRDRTASIANEGKYEWYKTTANFDGTERHPEWMG